MAANLFTGAKTVGDVSATPETILKSMKVILEKVADTTLTSIEYQGFDVVTFRKTVLGTWKLEQISIALMLLINRGTNLTRMLGKSGTGDDAKILIGKMQTLGVKNKADSKTAITLSRVAAAFPLEYLCAAKIMAGKMKLRPLLTPTQKVEIAQKYGLKNISDIFCLPGLASIMPGYFAKLYVEVCRAVSVVFQADKAGIERTTQLTIALGGTCEFYSIEAILEEWRDVFGENKVFKDTFRSGWDELRFEFRPSSKEEDKNKDSSKSFRISSFSDEMNPFK